MSTRVKRANVENSLPHGWIIPRLMCKIFNFSANIFVFSGDRAISMEKGELFPETSLLPPLHIAFYGIIFRNKFDGANKGVCVCLVQFIVIWSKTTPVAIDRNRKNTHTLNFMQT